MFSDRGMSTCLPFVTCPAKTCLHNPSADSVHHAPLLLKLKMQWLFKCWASQPLRGSSKVQHIDNLVEIIKLYLKKVVHH